LSDLLYYDRGDTTLRQFTKGKVEQIEDLNHTKKTIFIGGDHSISFPFVKHFFDCGEIEKVIVIDAHADFRDSYKNNRFSNACVTRRMAELRGSGNIIEIGVRSSSEEEYMVLKEEIMIYDAELLREKGVGWLLDVVGGREEKTYLSIDIDVLDPSIAPGVEHPEPCGMSLESLISLIREIIKRKDVVGSDVVEVNPRLDTINGITSINAARIIFEILACYWERDNRY
jgi:agmatinase